MNMFSIAAGGIACVSLALLIRLINWRAASTKLVQRAFKNIHSGYFSLESIEIFLQKKGAVHMFGSAATPTNFLLLKLIILFSVTVIGIALRYEIVVTFLLALAVTFIPDLLLNLSNDGDNKELLCDIQCLYDTLKIETHAGVYLTQALSECYLVVQNKRLKSALIDLTNEILAKNNIETALDVFEEQFDNQYISMFAIILRQSLESGQSAQMLADVSGELLNVQKAINLSIQESLDRKMQILQLLLFVGMMAILLYSMASSIISALSFGI